MRRKELDALLEEYADNIGVRVGHYETVPVGTPMLPETQVPGYGGESATPYQVDRGDGTEFRTIPSGIVIDHNTHYGYAIEQIAPNGRTWVSVLMPRTSNAGCERWLREQIAATAHTHQTHVEPSRDTDPPTCIICGQPAPERPGQ